MNNIEIINETEIKVNETYLNNIFSWLIEDKIFKHSDTCCLKLSDNDVIQELNAKYRGKNEPTDVLTFPCETKEIGFLGDIIVNCQFVGAISDCPDVEIAKLFIHGLLHLAGMDHLSVRQKNEMTVYEQKYVDKLRRGDFQSSFS